MAEISIDEVKQVIGALYLDLIVAQRDLDRVRATSAELLEATRPAVEPDSDDGPTPLPASRVRRKEG